MAAISESLQRMVRTLEDLAHSQRSNATEGERLRNLMEGVRRGMNSQREQSTALDRCLGELGNQAVELRGQLSKRN